MGQPTAFPEANLILLPPEGSEDAVIEMPTCRLDGAIASCWRLSPDEIAEIQRTGVVWLSVWGRSTHPPVLVTAHKHEVI